MNSGPNHLDYAVPLQYPLQPLEQEKDMATKEPSKDWKCGKCGDEYRSPIRVSDVLCAKCSKKVGSKETWMSPLEK